MIPVLTNQGASEESETTNPVMGRIRFCLVYFSLGIIWKVIMKKRGQNKFKKYTKQIWIFLAKSLSMVILELS